jgi:hypothetical protein
LSGRSVKRDGGEDRNHQTTGNVTSTIAATSTIIAGTLNRSLMSPYSTGDNAPAPTPPV